MSLKCPSRLARGYDGSWPFSSYHGIFSFKRITPTASCALSGMRGNVQSRTDRSCGLATPHTYIYILYRLLYSLDISLAFSFRKPEIDATFRTTKMKY
ncbi:hypothetical protein TNCV_1390881 [Trichonephila clavipes]|nr:hypothetical protein TNCV_1390881 [Trichonephila clavipes]